MSGQWRLTPSSILFREVADILTETRRRWPELDDDGDLSKMIATFREWSRVELAAESRTQPLQG